MSHCILVLNHTTANYATAFLSRQRILAIPHRNSWYSASYIAEPYNLSSNQSYPKYTCEPLQLLKTIQAEFRQLSRRVSILAISSALFVHRPSRSTSIRSTTQHLAPVARLNKVLPRLYLRRLRQYILTRSDVLAAVVYVTYAGSASFLAGKRKGNEFTPEFIKELKHLREFLPDHRLELVGRRLNVGALDVIDWRENASATIHRPATADYETSKDVNLLRSHCSTTSFAVISSAQANTSPSPGLTSSLSKAPTTYAP
jgi:hypothetical protein